jgi:hypothetical protein
MPILAELSLVFMLVGVKPPVVVAGPRPPLALEPAGPVRVEFGGLPRFSKLDGATWLKSGISADEDDTKPGGDKHAVVRTEVKVVAGALAFDMTEGFQRPVTALEVETSAGTFGDVSRFLQMLAGVTGDNDQRNDVLVRGGNPAENLFTIDNIEIPSINQLALSDTTGGFVSMLDANAIRQITLHTDAYDSRFEQRLSSVIEISTRSTEGVQRHATTEAGIAGVGGSLERPLGKDGSMFVSARQSVLQLMTNDIGLNGVPKYENAFVRADGGRGRKDSWWGISLTGRDSIDIVPSAGDFYETNPYNVTYRGWRNTTGGNWQHVFSPKVLGVASGAFAEQSQTIAETAQLENGSLVYKERTSDGIATGKYDITVEAGRHTTLTGGARASLDEVNYAVGQPIGLQNPYSTNPAPIDAGAFARKFETFSSSGYGQAAIGLGHEARLVVGGRAMQWALGGNHATDGKALFSFPLAGRMLHFGYAEYTQMPETLYLLSFDNVRSLAPIRSRQATAGVVVADRPRERITLELYNKTYTDYPVAANLPQLSLANVADTFGQAFLMFPMVAKGQGRGRGAELTVQEHVTTGLNVTATLAYSRSEFTGLDGVWRRGNFDLPLATNLSGVWSLRHGFAASARFTATSGKPYTPDNLALSTVQDRDVYDLTRVNGVRSPAYARLDFRVEQARKLGLGVLTWHAGLQNALDRKNFYSYQWRPRAPSLGPLEQDQMPLFPDGGLKYSF